MLGILAVFARIPIKKTYFGFKGHTYPKYFSASYSLNCEMYSLKVWSRMGTQFIDKTEKVLGLKMQVFTTL